MNQYLNQQPLNQYRFNQRTLNQHPCNRSLNHQNRRKRTRKRRKRTRRRNPPIFPPMSSPMILPSPHLQFHQAIEPQHLVWPKNNWRTQKTGGIVASLRMENGRSHKNENPATIEVFSFLINTCLSPASDRLQLEFKLEIERIQVPKTRQDK